MYIATKWLMQKHYSIVFTPAFMVQWRFFGLNASNGLILPVLKSGIKGSWKAIRQQIKKC